jgi:tetratricopeptide (TPR) repeat protein
MPSVPRITCLTLLCVILPSGICAQTQAEGKLESAFKELSQLLKEGELTKSEAILKDVLNSPRSEPARKPGEINISLYGLAWGMLIEHYLENEDYPNAERVLQERIRIAEDTYGKDHMGGAVFLGLLADVHRRLGEYDAAIPLFTRSLEIYKKAGLADGLVARAIFTGLAESLLATGKAQEAVILLKPVAEDTTFRSLEEILNSYAVALREAGMATEAQKVEVAVNDSYLRPGINEQYRDFLRARLATYRGAPQEAETIYRDWIKHWEDWGATVSTDPKEREWDRILMDPLGDYLHFLVSQERREDAALVRLRLQSIRKKYDR